MLVWKKHGLIFDTRKVTDKPPWFSEFAQAPNAIIFDNFIRVFFCCRPQVEANGMFVSYGSFVDLDRNHFKILRLAREPILALGGLGEFDEFGTYPISTIKHGDQVYAFYGGWTRCESVPFNVAIGCAVSGDGGITFKKQGPGPALGHSLEEPFVVTSPKIRRFNDKWWLTYTAGKKWFLHEGRPEIVYKLRMAFSDDGVHWTRVNKNIIGDKIGEDEAQACGDILLRNGVYHMFFCYRQATDFRFAKDRSYRIGYARSTDLLHWERDDARVGIDISTDGWDSEMVAYPHTFELDGRIFMLYLGNEVGRCGFGLAELQGDLL